MARPQSLSGHVLASAIAVTALTVSTASASANSWIAFGDPSLPCDGSYDAVTAKVLHRATVRPPDGGRLHFVAGRQGRDSACPSLVESCRLQSYLVAGDQVLVSSGTGDFACVHYVAAPGKVTSGLVPAPSLTFESDGDNALDARAGLGGWSAGDATITIKRGGDGFVLIEGDATRGPPSYNMGAIAGPAYLSSDGKGAAGYTDDHYDGEQPAAENPPASEGCRVRLRRFGPFLVVDDNDRCGGNGVSFSGLYVKR